MININFKCKLSVDEDELGGIDKEYEIPFLGGSITVTLKDRVNPLTIMQLANIEFIHLNTGNGEGYLKLLRDNYGVVFDEKLESQMVALLKKPTT